MQKRGFYIVKEEFFDEINDCFLKRNKSGNRPHYYCFEDSKEGIVWLKRGVRFTPTQPDVIAILSKLRH